MGITNPQVVDLTLNGINGRVRSGYPPQNLDNSWRIAAPYRLAHVFDMSPVHPRHTDAGAMAYFKWADTKSEYVCRPSWFGGEAPYRLTLVQAPAGATLGGGSEQTFTRALSAHSGVYTHSVPNDYATIRWQPTVGQHGQTFRFTLLVEDQNDGVLILSWSTIVDDSKFKYLDSVNGNNTNSGTYALPYQTFAYAYGIANAQNYIFKYKAGTYLVNNGTEGSSAVLDSTHCVSHIGIESGVVFDLTTGGFGTGTADIHITNVTLSGGRVSTGNVRQINLSEQSSRLTINRVIFDTTVIGSVGKDNPCGVMTYNIDPSYHEHVSITDCTLTAASKTAMYVLFSVRNSIIENTYSYGTNMPLGNGALIGHLKHACYNVSLRFADYNGNPDNGILWVSNQGADRCANIDITFCRFVTTQTATSYTVRWNGQVTSPQTRPVGQYIQRCSIDAGTIHPLTFEDYVAGYDVNYSACILKTTLPLVLTNGQSVGNSSIKVTDINAISVDDIGKRGWVIASTMVN